MEIERKFLVNKRIWIPKDEGTLIRQGYISTVKERIVRIRVAANHATLTVKGRTVGYTRLEYEYPIPHSDAEDMLKYVCEQPLIEKTRHHEIYDGMAWEIDVFHGPNDGLIIAEIELSRSDDLISKPDWAEREVSLDSRYFNNSLVLTPYNKWRSNSESI